MDADSPISGVIRNGDTINVSKSDVPTLVVAQSAKNPSTSNSEPATAPLSVVEPKGLETEEKKPIIEEEVELKPKRPTAEDLEGFESQADFGRIVRRVMPDDNSCLFHTIAYILEGEKVAKPETIARLREVVAKAVLADPIAFDAATLGKSTAEYARWIRQANSWGGAIELSIYAKIYATEIFALDVINGIGSCFGEDEGFGRRVYCIFDGIHYDAIALSPVPEEMDLDITECKPWDQPIEQMALDFLQQEKRAGKFTDTQNFQILCQQCQTILKGEKGAAMHAMQTGHSQFVEKR